LPARTIICMPSKSTEAWVIATIFPRDQSMKTGIECFPNPAGRLAQQPKRNRLRKNQREYRARFAQFESAWPRLTTVGGLSEALRFQSDFLTAMNGL
jgi:hypothetical protein